MVISNQNEFNKEYPKEIKEIKMEDEEFEGQQLIIEDYPELKELYLNDNEDIEKIVLKNLERLKECKIWKCGAKELIIENCPQINKLDVHNNSLTNLEFLRDLECLEKLKLDGNDELIKILDPYEDWKDYQKDLQKSDKNTLELLRNIRVLEREKKTLNIKYTELKKFLKEKIFISLSQDTKKELVDELDREVKRKGSLSAPGMTKELMLNTEAVISSAKEIKKELEAELVKSKAKTEELEKELEELKKTNKDKKVTLEQKKKELEELKSNYLTKVGSYDKEKLSKFLEKLLKTQIEIVRINSDIAIEQEIEIKSKLIKKTLLTIEELDNLCQLQKEITELEIELGKINQKVTNITNNIITANNISQSIIGVEGNVKIGGSFSPQQNLTQEEFIAQQLHETNI